MGIQYLDVNSLGPDSTRLEVLDYHDKPIAVLPERTVHKQGLRHLRVAALVFSPAGNLLISRRSAQCLDGPLCWDASLSAHVYAGYSGYETLRQGLYTHLGMPVSKLRFVHYLEAVPETEYETLHIYTVKVRSDQLQTGPPQMDNSMILQKHEVRYLVDNFPGQITSTLRVLGQHRLLFESGL